ncbi:MAG: hypothetical protein AB7F98_18235 [Novosphingobium sp.]
MSGSPPTFGTDPSLHGEVNWDDAAALHRRDDGGGLLYDMKAVHRGTLAEVVRHFMLLPEADRRSYVIEKAGDHRLDWAEVAELAARPDYPG